MDRQEGKYSTTRLSVVPSGEELKIWCELEMEIERDLEEEIKDGIYHRALRLHRLYQHQKERNNANRNTFSEVNINIRMEGETKIEIKETKKKDPRPRTSRSENVFVSNAKKFDWVKTLRSGKCPSTPTPISKKNVSLHQGKMLSKERSLRNFRSGSGHGKKILSVNNNELLELGWKS